MSPHMSHWPKRPLYILESPFHTCLCTRYLHCTYIVCSYLCMCDLHLDCYDRLDKNSFTIFPSQALEFVISSVIIMVGFFSKFFSLWPYNWQIFQSIICILDCSRFVTGHFKWDWFILSSTKPKCNDKLSIDFVFWSQVFYKDCSWFGFKSESILPILFKNHLKKSWCRWLLLI